MPTLAPFVRRRSFGFPRGSCTALPGSTPAWRCSPASPSSPSASRCVCCALPPEGSAGRAVVAAQRSATCAEGVGQRLLLWAPSTGLLVSHKSCQPSVYPSACHPPSPCQPAQDLQDAYNTTVRGMLLAFKERLPAIDVDWLLGDTGEPQLQVGGGRGRGWGGRGAWGGAWRGAVLKEQEKSARARAVVGGNWGVGWGGGQFLSHRLCGGIPLWACQIGRFSLPLPPLPPKRPPRPILCTVHTPSLRPATSAGPLHPPTPAPPPIHTHTTPTPPRTHTGLPHQPLEPQAPRRAPLGARHFQQKSRAEEAPAGRAHGRL